MSRFIKYILFTIIIFQMTNCSNNKKIADLVLLNGNIVTVDSANAISQAIAISGDTIIAIGKNDEIKKLIGSSTKVIDLKGQTAIPGFIESHAHFISTGEALLELDLSNAKNWDEIILLAKNAAEKSKIGEWIIGRGWHQEKWNSIPEDAVEGFPTHKKLSEAVPNNPIIFSHASGHAIFANAKAMEISNVTNLTQNPAGGIIIKDKNGFPTGIFLEDAEKLITKKYNEDLNKKSKRELKDKIKKAIKLANEECLKNGITTFHDAGESFESLNIIKNMVENNELDIRLYVMLGENYVALKDSLRKYFTIGYVNNHLTVRSIKLYMDGALGSRGAWLLEPYSDMPNQYGMNTTSLDEINLICKIAAENDFQICTHAIGDKANREILNVYENIFKNYPGKNFRWRIEHAQHINPNDIPRFNQLGVIAAMQGIHCTSDAPFVEKRLGKDRAESGAYVWKSLINSGTIICNGTDSPVEKLNPIKNFHATVTRKTNDGNLFYENQKMSRLEALKSYTINGAFAAFEENIKGSLEIGKLADITILSQDLLNISDDEILNTEIIYTIVGGKILYERK
ncbi:MAG: amidohydrolase [Ignavibacteriae bacterium]|nr:amidohydrolase [Ignavibacteriota bacterium]